MVPSVAAAPPPNAIGALISTTPSNRLRPAVTQSAAFTPDPPDGFEIMRTPARFTVPVGLPPTFNPTPVESEPVPIVETGPRNRGYRIGPLGLVVVVLEDTDGN